MKINLIHKILFIISFSLMIVSCTTNSSSISKDQLLAEYFRGMKEHCYFDPISITEHGPLYLSDKNCDQNIENAKNENYYDNNAVLPTTLKDAYYLGMKNDCELNPIGATNNNELFYRNVGDCNKWILNMKSLGIYEQRIISDDGKIRIPNFLLTPVAPTEENG